jgi:CheY-like chemotaxis protein
MAQDGITIVLVEDDEGHAELVRRHLRRAGIENPLELVDRGSEALDYVYRRGRYAERDEDLRLVVLLDINMPGELDGLDVLRQLKADPNTRRIPVVMLSTADDPREIARCYDLGCNAFVTKPVDPVRFSDAIRRIGLLLSVASLPPARQLE